MDETGSTFRARLGTTWAPVGHPPQLRRVSKRREISSMVALVAPSKRGRARLYARHFEGSVHGAQAVAALRYFHRKVGRPLVVVWDRLGVHRSQEVKDFVEAHSEDFVLEEFPAYAPELNPEEGCNSQVKLSMLNATPESVADLHRQVRAAFVRLGRRHTALRGFFGHAGLSLRGLT
ncbi:transposase [Myxococcus xanthus]|uniref:transposase n=1 Tax=Myxococcus xanthus TaxID=34 RepID=UPI0013763FD5|nr:transposase [Myxococcus xanthus]